MLYLISTPIGNLGDLSFRALKTIEECEYLLCEDTRRVKQLLTHYEMPFKKLVSMHKFNEKAREKQVLEDLQAGMTLGVITDAGTPGIADPGERLVMACRKEGIPVYAIPGACSIVAALSISGLPTLPFQCIGFLPPKSGRLQTALQSALNYPGTTVCLETPHRLLKTLKILAEIAPERHLVVLRELTKKFEHFYHGTAAELLGHWPEHPPKGEIVLLISPA